MKNPMGKFYEFVERPLFPASRFVLVALLVPLALSFFLPLWRISMSAPQYPDGLYMDIYSYKLEGGDGGQHVTEINTLNHYIGMHRIDRTALSDLDWLPFALGILGLLALRVAALGNVRSLLDLVALTGYVSGFAFIRFIYKLYVFGHDLAPDAPVKIPPFMPVVLGTKQIANFTTHSYPLAGSAGLGAFSVGLVVLALWHLVAGRRAAERAERSELPPAATATAA